jgi:hypothetical protein
MTARLRCPDRQHLIHLGWVASYTTPVFDHQGVVLRFQIRVIRQQQRFTGHALRTPDEEGTAGPWVDAP